MTKKVKENSFQRYQEKKIRIKQQIFDRKNPQIKQVQDLYDSIFNINSDNKLLDTNMLDCRNSNYWN